MKYMLLTYLDEQAWHAGIAHHLRHQRMERLDSDHDFGVICRCSGRQADQHAGKTESADRWRQGARLSSCSNHVGRRRLTGGDRRCKQVSSG